jgi:hypothetical protein
MAFRSYLQQILWTTPEQWHHHRHRRSNYSTVIWRLQDWQNRNGERVALVTFNYGTLLDRAFAAAVDFDPASQIDVNLPGYLANSNFVFSSHTNWSIGRVASSPMCRT